MSRIKFNLNDGLSIGDDVLKDVVLREINAGDIIKASEESEKLVFTPAGKGQPEPILVSSPAMMGVHVLRRQIVSIGNLNGPIDLHTLEKLSAEDFEILQNKANELEKAAVAELASQAVTHKGRSD